MLGGEQRIDGATIPRSPRRRVAGASIPFGRIVATTSFAHPNRRKRLAARVTWSRSPAQVQGRDPVLRPGLELEDQGRAVRKRPAVSQAGVEGAGGPAGVERRLGLGRLRVGARGDPEHDVLPGAGSGPVPPRDDAPRPGRNARAQLARRGVRPGERRAPGGRRPPLRRCRRTGPAGRGPILQGAGLGMRALGARAFFRSAGGAPPVMSASERPDGGEAWERRLQRPGRLGLNTRDMRATSHCIIMVFRKSFRRWQAGLTDLTGFRGDPLETSARRPRQSFATGSRRETQGGGGRIHRGFQEAERIFPREHRPLPETAPREGGSRGRPLERPLRNPRARSLSTLSHS